jgi:hypothetical protein
MTIQARAARDPAFREAMFQEAMQALLRGDVGGGRAALDRSPKSLMRMFGPGGNPTAENLLSVIGALQARTGVRLEVRAVADAA